ncbi:MAG: bifunctional UDP-N-acetylglucosamine diphosphorylase/glucosamine-1-phosphate N-acetyltransferase GlmU [Gammaproteobacteria bacterium]|nr:bifunctional UDP-N-acetylglucosamine diphosphorylase/glucosamine-1-phosphate N-acetyltransferase GlmU [Gammaproteobacteria bacterium]
MMLSTVILAAGQGKRMHSDTPKVLHRIAGKALLEHVVNTASLINSNPPIVIYGHEGEKVKQILAQLNAQWVQQPEQLGTGHALLQALPHIADDHRVLVLYGDVPLIQADTLKKFIQATPGDALGILTAHFPDPTGLGRILRDEKGNITSIIEDKDADANQKNIHEINSGIYLIPATLLKRWLPTLKNQNAQKEYYLTDIVALAATENIAIHSTEPATYEEVLGINDRLQLAKLERFYQHKMAEKFMRQGVTLHDPARFDVRGELSVGRDTSIDINVIFEGHVKIGSHCIIGPHCVLRNVILGDRVEIKANSVLDGAEIAEDCIVGPFARLRPGSILAPRSHVGNFVEIKNSEIGTGSKVNHLSYVGDSEVGKNVNIGAGTITCNYDGLNKNRTIIGDNAFIGSNSSLIAPITIGEGATIGAGSTISRDAQPHQLTVARSPQRSIANWQRPQKKEI